MANRLHLCTLVPLVALAAACSKPSAMEVCKKLEGVGVAKDCRVGKKTGPAAIAKERVEFDLPISIVSGTPGEVLTFNEDREYNNTLRTYNQRGSTNALHRIGSRDALVFTAFSESAPPEFAENAQKVFDDL